MTKRDALQTAINQASLTLMVGEDVFKALKNAQVHPDLAKVIMNMHHSLRDQEREIKELRTSLVQVASLADRGASVTAAIMIGVDALANRLGYNPQDLFAPEKPDDSTPSV